MGLTLIETGLPRPRGAAKVIGLQICSQVQSRTKRFESATPQAIRAQTSGGQENGSGVQPAAGGSRRVAPERGATCRRPELETPDR